jgi:hypothetical protein
MNEHPFSDDWYLMVEINELRKRFNIKTVIETGTWKGNTAFVLSTLFDKVITIEINEEFYNEAEWLDEASNVTRLLGDSSYWLDIYGKLNYKGGPTRIFLDAHSFGQGCPLHKELDALIKNDMSNCILVVHDCLVPPNLSLRYDVYEEIPISFEYISGCLNKLYGFGRYVHYWNKEAVGEKVGVLFVTPAEEDFF